MYIELMFVFISHRLYVEMITIIALEGASLQTRVDIAVALADVFFEDAEIFLNNVFSFIHYIVIS
jgi:hypothetical protein